MYTESKLFFMICESPLHAGSGSDLDFIENPIQRERHTGYPKLEASSLKGALRERFSQELGRNSPGIKVGFGPDDPKPGNERQGSLGFTDGRLLLFPVKSMKGVFAWVSCYAVLERFKQDMRRTAGNQKFDIQPFLPISDGEAIVFSEDLVVKNENGEEQIVLEEYAFAARQDAAIKVDDQLLQSWLANQLFPAEQFEFWNAEIKNKLVIVSDNDFADFVELTTEVITRNKINPQTGTVAAGHLFSEEYLPSDSVLYALAMSHAEFHEKGEGKSAEETMRFFTENLVGPIRQSFQAGGNATIGKGLIRTVLHDALENPIVE